MRAMVLPIFPWPTIATFESVSAALLVCNQMPLLWFCENSAKPRRAAIAKPTASSAVDASCTPAALQRVTPFGRIGITSSTPAFGD